MKQLLNNVAEIILCVYAVVKHVIGRNFTNEKTNPLFFIAEHLLYLVFALVICILVTLIILPFVLIKETTSLYLKRKIGIKYNGLLNGMDAVWTCDTEEAKHIVNSIVFLQIKTSPEDFIVFLKQKIKDTKDLRFTSALHCSFGYYYRIHSDNIHDKAIRSIKFTPSEISSKQDFEERISDLANQPLPDLSSYEILISDEPVKFHGETDEENKTHVVILRVHHSMGDAYSLLSYLLKIVDLSDKDENCNETRAILKNCHISTQIKLKDISSKDSVLNYLNRALDIMKNTSVYYFPLLAPHDNNILHGCKLSGKKILVYDIEYGRDYISKVKSIKSIIKDCRFSDVIYTAISASLSEYLAQHAEIIPEDIHMSFISRVKGDFCAITIELPVNFNGMSQAESLTQRLNKIKTRHTRALQSIDGLVFYWLSHIASFLPVILSRKLCKLGMKTTISFSNVPGIKSVTVDRGRLKDMIFWTPNVSKTGMGFSVFTYDGRLQLGLITDRVLLKPEEASLVLKNVYKYIDLLAKTVGAKE